MTPNAAQGAKDSAKAKFLLLILGVVWGLNWPAVKVSLSGVSPWTLRTIGLGAAACTLFVLALVRGRSLRIAAGRDRKHIVMTGLLNIALFNILLTFAQLGAATSRVAIITYSMPLWATLFARIVLGEKLDRVRGMGLALGAGGLAVLIAPLLGGGLHGLPWGILYALAAALTWAAGTVYMKWAKIGAEPLAIAAWQLLIGALVALSGLLSFEGWPIRAPCICKCSSRWRITSSSAWRRDIFYGSKSSPNCRPGLPRWAPCWCRWLASAAPCCCWANVPARRTCWASC